MAISERRPVDFDADLQVYEPHKAGIPPIPAYFKDLASRLPFAAEFSKSGIRAAHSQTVFGQLWLVLNPLLLALVYFLLVSVINRGRSAVDAWDYLAHIAGGLFLFTFFSTSLASGAGSVTGGGRLILNMAFPRLLMPMAAVRTAFFRFLPTLPVYLLLMIISGAPWSPVMLLGVVFLLLTIVFSVGMAAVLATMQVYFRDTTSFLPYFLRIWLYLSPVLWFTDRVPERWHDLMLLNPLFPLIGGWTDITLRAQVPGPEIWLAAVAWAVVGLVGGSLVFMSRERDFAVRI